MARSSARHSSRSATSRPARPFAISNRWLRRLLLGLGGTCALLGVALLVLGAQYRAGQRAQQEALAASQQVVQAQREEIRALQEEVENLKNFTSAEINAKLAALKKSEAMVRELQNYLFSRGVHVKPVSVEPPAGQPNPAAGGPADELRITRPVPYTGTFVEDAGNLLETLQTVPLGLPHGGPISSRFGYRANPFTGQGYEFHGGLDFAGNIGQAIAATAGGVVSFSGVQGGYGKVVVVSHGHGYSTLYAHLSEILVREGQRIRAGEIVGQLGNTGRSTGPHLHYEVQLRGERLNPEGYLAPGTPP